MFKALSVCHNLLLSSLAVDWLDVFVCDQSSHILFDLLNAADEMLTDKNISRELYV